MVVEKIGISLVARGLKNCPTTVETKTTKSAVRFMRDISAPACVLRSRERWGSSWISLRIEHMNIVRQHENHPYSPKWPFNYMRNLVFEECLLKFRIHVSIAIRGN
uniref:Uncharacterized protein n=1 Tax=Bionectria ochroleuca TaxID=29856 RepID=A0A8H7MZ35_BIOOC